MKKVVSFSGGKGKPRIFVGDEVDTVNFGKFTVLEYINTKNVLVRFLDTGYETNVHSSNASSGSVKDLMRPSVYGVGFIGDGLYSRASHGEFHEKWRKMIQRCYDINVHKTHPTYKDCEVCEEWQDFQVFAKWIEPIYFTGCEVDKDINVRDNKIYHPDMCKLVTRTENIIDRNKRVAK